MDQLENTTATHSAAETTDADNGRIVEQGGRRLPEHLCSRICELAASRELSVEALMESLLAAAPRALDTGIQAGTGRRALPPVTAAAVVEMVRENRASGGFV